MIDTMPTFAMPDNTRQIVLSRREFFYISLRLLRPGLIRFCLFIPALYFLLQLAINNLDTALDPARWLYFLKPVSIVFLLWLLAIFLILRRKVRVMKGLGIPVLFGFNQEAVYVSCVYYQSHIRWEFFSAWQEEPTAFLLHDGARQLILPKSSWSQEELACLRDLLRAKANPRSHIAA